LKTFGFIGVLALPFIPFGLSAANFFLVGGLDWSMHWDNEAGLWTLLFSIPVLLLGIRSIVLKSQKKIVLYGIVLFFAFFVAYDFGIKPSSKADASSLEPTQFWLSQWSYW